MHLKRTLNSIRYRRGVSLFARTLGAPLHALGRTVSGQIEKKIWINGGRLDYDGMEIQFPSGDSETLTVLEECSYALFALTEWSSRNISFRVESNETE